MLSAPGRVEYPVWRRVGDEDLGVVRNPLVYG